MGLSLRSYPVVAGAWLVCALATSVVGADATGTWDVVKSQHFLVHHAGDAAFAERVAERAEAYYETIASDLGYTRRSGFWLWENRVRILIYPTAQAFRDASNAPGWAIGRASSRRHEIAGCRTDGEGFLTTVLPHEMTHLVLGEFVGDDHLPQWLSEGLAQWEQGGRPKTMPLANPAAAFALKDLMSMDVRQEKDSGRVQAYYAQCASLVGFLVTRQGGERLGQFCRALRDGKETPRALAQAYPDVAASVEALEQAWRRSATDAHMP